MGLFPLVLVSSLISNRDHARSEVSEDPEKARNQVESDVADDNDSIQDSDPQDADDDEPDEPSPQRRRVTFDTPPGGPTPPEKAPAKPGFLTRFKTVIFPPQDENKSISSYRALPVIAGLVIPFSILLEIPGLTDSWYIRTDNNIVVESRRNSPGYEVMLAISMVFAVAANVSLICRFLDKGSVLTTTLITMASLTIHDVMNIIVVVIFGVAHRFDDGFTYGHGYWMTVCSTSVSTVTNISLIWDLVWTRNFSQRGSGVSRTQRSLLIIVMILLVYIAFGALVNTLLIKVDFINGLYFTVVSIETVGFGDIAPNNTSSRVFMCAYIIFGILNLGVAVGVARETIFEHLHHSYQIRLARIPQKYQEKRNWRIWERKWKSAVEWRLREIGADIWMPDPADDSESTIDITGEEPRREVMLFVSRVFRIGFGRPKHENHFRNEGEIQGAAYGHPGTHLNVESLSRAQLEAAAVESGVPLCVIRALRRRRAYLSRTHTITSQSSASTTQYWTRWFWSQHEPLPTERPTTKFMRGLEDMSGILTKFAIATTGAGMNRMPRWTNATTPDTPRNRPLGVQRSYTLDSTVSEIVTLARAPRPVIQDDFQEIAGREERKAFWAKLVVAWTLFMVFLLAGAVLFMATEKWPFGIALYFCFITFTTTGYGDFSPKTASGRSVFVLWALLGLATMTILVSVLQDAFSSKYKSAVHSGIFENIVKKYRQRTKNESKKKAKRGITEKLTIPVGVSSLDIKESSARAQQDLECLPGQVLEQVGVIHRYVRHLVRAEPEDNDSADLNLILDDINRARELDEKVRTDILHDKDARNTLWMIGIEKALRELIDVAESTQSAVAERDLMAVGYEEQHHVTEYEKPEDCASGSGTCHDATPQSDSS